KKRGSRPVNAGMIGKFGTRCEVRSSTARPHSSALSVEDWSRQIRIVRAKRATNTLNSRGLFSRQGKLCTMVRGGKCGPPGRDLFPSGEGRLSASPDFQQPHGNCASGEDH